MTKIMQCNDTKESCRRLQRSRGGGCRHLINIRQIHGGTGAMRESNGTKLKNECGSPRSRMYFLGITYRKHSRRFGVKVLEAVVEARYTTGTEMKGRFKGKYGFCSPEGKQLLSGAQRA